jgi:hypothetical protein
VKFLKYWVVAMFVVTAFMGVSYGLFAFLCWLSLYVSLDHIYGALVFLAVTAFLAWVVSAEGGGW